MGNRPAIILGGGKSLREDLLSVPESDAIFIGVNHHWRKVLTAVDYFVTIHNPKSPYAPTPQDKIDFFAAFEETGAEIVSIYPPADHIIEDHVSYQIINSGQLATLFAYRLTKGPLYLCGFDLYQDSDEPKEDLYSTWYFLFRRLGTNRIKPMSGPLMEMAHGW